MTAVEDCSGCRDLRIVEGCEGPVNVVELVEGFGTVIEGIVVAIGGGGVLHTTHVLGGFLGSYSFLFGGGHFGGGAVHFRGFG